MVGVHFKSTNLYDYLTEAKEFKNKGDNLYKGKKYEQDYKVYEIAYDLLTDYWADHEK